MSGNSQTLIFAVQHDIAAPLRDAFLDGTEPHMGPDEDPIGLYSSSRNNHIETSLRPLIRTAGVTGLGYLESLSDFRADRPEGVDIGAFDHGFALSSTALQEAADGVRALLSALEQDLDIFRRAFPELADMDDAMLLRDLGPSPDEHRRCLAQMNAAHYRNSARPVRPHRYSLSADYGPPGETAMFLIAHLDILEVALAEGLAVVVVCWKY